MAIMIQNAWRIYKYIDTLLIYTFSSDFLNNFDAQNDLGKIFVTKNLLTWTILILSMLFSNIT